MQNPDELLPIHGSAISGDAPAVGQTVRLRRGVRNQRNASSCDFADAAFKEARVQQDGGYRFQVYRAEGQPLNNAAQFCFRVETTFPSGSSAWSDLNALLLDNPVAPLRDWQTVPYVDGGRVVFEPVIPLPPDDFRSFQDPTPPARQLDHEVELVSDAGTIWRTSDDRFDLVDGGARYERQPLQLDEERVEDFAGVLQLRATLTDYTLRSQYAFYDLSLPGVVMRPPLDPLVQGATVPLSRGLPCPPFASPCPFTDGSLELVDGGREPSLVVVLPATTALRTLLLRDLGVFRGEVHVEQTLEDGGLWSTIDGTVTGSRGISSEFITLPDGGFAGLTNSYRAIDLDAGAAVTRVTLTFPNGGLVSLRELSLF
jgi:hypothetical protein